MAYTDLPTGWAARSLTDLFLAADVVDLVVREEDRSTGSVSLLLCDADGRMIQPVTVADVPPQSSEAERAAFFDAFLDHLGRALGAVVLAIGSPDDAVIETLRWHDSGVTACRAAGVELIGTYLATPGRVRLVACGQEPQTLAG